MNKSKALLGWNADLVNGRDFRVEDRLDGVGQTIAWLADSLPAPRAADLEAGWAAWQVRLMTPPLDPLHVLAAQIEALRQAVGLPAEKAFQSYLETQASGNLIREKHHDRG